MTTFGPRPLSSKLARGIGFLALWVVLIAAAPQDLPIGIVSAAAAAWVSERLWPPAGRISPAGLLRFIPRFLPQSLVAGVDVARLAFASDRRRAGAGSLSLAA
jgi:multicomponent Na+:H+ antiporter subunit E